MDKATASLPLMLKQLRLGSIRELWQTIAEKAIHEQWSPQQYLAELCSAELASREDGYEVSSKSVAIHMFWFGEDDYSAKVMSIRGALNEAEIKSSPQ